jgi:hypothetical protein
MNGKMKHGTALFVCDLMKCRHKEHRSGRKFDSFFIIRNIRLPFVIQNANQTIAREFALPPSLIETIKEITEMQSYLIAERAHSKLFEMR